MNIRVDGILYNLESNSDFILTGLLAECQDRFKICHSHKHRTTEIEDLQQGYACKIQAIKAELERRESLREKRAA